MSQNSVRMFWKRYAVVFGIGLIIANAYALWPAFAYSRVIDTTCPIIVGAVSYEAQGAAQVVGPPLHAEMQILVHPGSTAYETEIHRSNYYNLTDLSRDYPFPGDIPFRHYLYQIDGVNGSLHQIAANGTGVTITFENITFQGIHVARILYRLDVSSSAEKVSYELGFVPCETGLVLTVGFSLYTGPLAIAKVQLISIIISNGVGLVGSTVACIPLTFYWKRPKTSSRKNNSENAPVRPTDQQH